VGPRRDGRLVGRARLIGQRFPDNHELKEALAGEVAVEIKTLAGREHAYERPSFTTLAEV
jgi:hypothetical protein